MVSDKQEMCLNTRGLRDPGFYPKYPELQQQLWSHCRAVPQSSEVPGFVSSSDQITQRHSFEAVMFPRSRVLLQAALVNWQPQSFCDSLLNYVSFANL